MSQQSFDPSAIRHVSGIDGPQVAVIEAIMRAKPDWNYNRAYAHWNAFRASTGLPPPARVHLPQDIDSRGKRRIANTMVADVPTVAKLLLSLPAERPSEQFGDHALAMYSHYGITPSPVLMHRPILAPADAVVALNPPEGTESEEVSLAQGVNDSLLNAMPIGAAAQIGQVFQNALFCLRAFQDAEGRLWFKGSEVATALGYANLAKAIRDHVHPSRRSKMQNLQLARGSDSGPLTKYEQEATWITEPGVYELLLASHSAVANQFREWFVTKVLPQLARTGKYSPEPLPDPPADMLKALQVDLAIAQAETERARLVQIRLENKRTRLDIALLARRAANELGLDVSGVQLQAERAAVDLAVLPAKLREDGYVTAGDYLRMRGHSEAEVRSLQVTYGLMLKREYERLRGTSPPGHFSAEFGGHVKTPCCYDRQADRAMLNGVYQLLTLTDVYRRQVPRELLALNSVA